MGLHNRHDSASGFTVATIRHWHTGLGLAIVCLLIAATGDEGRALLKYHRVAIADGDYYRLVSAHFTHLGLGHLALNMAGLLLIWMLVGRFYSAAQWLFVALLSLCVISGGFWFFDRDMLWYVGLSGILHGLLAAGALRGMRTARGESVVMLVMLAAKLAWEQIAGAVPGSETFAGGEVIVNAHWYGSLGGTAAALLLWRRAAEPASI